MIWVRVGGSEHARFPQTLTLTTLTIILTSQTLNVYKLKIFWFLIII
jgi:hypothetical protein